MGRNWSLHTLLVGYEKVQPLRGTVWKFLQRLNIELSQNLAILLGIYPRELKTYVCTKTYMEMFIAA